MENFRHKGSAGNGKKIPMMPDVGRNKRMDSHHTNKDVLCHSRRPPREDTGKGSNNGKKSWKERLGELY